MNLNKHLVVLCGPSGIGKTQVAIALAKQLRCDIISADSRQIYREMKIGTAVPALAELAAVPHHFIQSHSIHTYYNASKFEVEVLDFLEGYYKTKEFVLMVGGSGLYIDAVCKGIDDLPAIDPEVREKWATLFSEKGLYYLRRKVHEIDPDYLQQTDINNSKRLLKAIEVFEMTGKPYSTFLKHERKPRSFNVIKVGLDTDRKCLYDQINRRVDKMIKDGLMEEAEQLYPYRHLGPLNTVGYKELFACFDGTMGREEAIEHIKSHTRSYARRQLTWFRRDKEIHWFGPHESENILTFITESMLKFVKNMNE